MEELKSTSIHKDINIPLDEQIAVQLILDCVKKK
jgi:hypothetical protein